MQIDNLRGVCLVVSLSLNFTTRQTPHKLRLMAALGKIVDRELKLLTVPLLTLGLLSCGDTEITFQEPKPSASIEELCGVLKLGMQIEESDKIMAGIGTSKVTIASGPKSGSGYIRYWNAPSNAEIIIEEPLRAVIPHGVICVVNYNASLEIYEVKPEFVSEESYQEKVKIMNE